MRKRAQLKMPIPSESAPTPQPEIGPERRRFHFKKNWWIGLSLIAIFFLVLFMNAYFNIVSNVNMNPSGTTLTDKFYLSGPDPYYNMRLVDNTVQTGRFPFYSEKDPLLAYPFGKSGGRAPLLVMSAIGFSKFLVPFMSESDALGYAMEFVPALFGALLIFPVYFIGKNLFGRKAGLIAALLIAIIPIEISSGHGSAYGLFDHDSFNLLLYFLTFLFLIKSIKETDKTRSILYALLAGIPLAALSMVWVEAQFLYTVIALYAIIQILIDIFTNKVEERFIMSIAIVLFTGFFVSWPVTLAGGVLLDLPFYLALGILLFGGICIIFKRKKIPWIISFPMIIGIGAVAATFLYVVYTNPQTFSLFAPLNAIAQIIYGSGIYGSKVSLTIAEAGTYNISRTVMSFGPALYWLAWAGFALLIYQYGTQKEKRGREYMFILVLFLIQAWLTTTAGRFLNDMVPVIAILAGWVTWFLISKVDYKQMSRNIRNAGGGFRGLRKGVKIYHVLGVLFVAFIVLIPNGYLALDAAVPSAATKNGTSNMKYDFFGKDHSSAFGSSSYKEQYWVDAYSWLNKQDTNITEPVKRPAFISWWDYGFYEVAVGGHPTVADNFQDGIPPAANFHTAKSEKEGVAVWIVRLLEGNRNDNNGGFSSDVIAALQKHLGENNTKNVTSWMINPALSPSQHAPVGAQYDPVLSETLRVGAQYPENAYYHDITQLLNNTLTDEEITWLYHDVQQATGYSIRYYGVEGYDEQIFNIFAFLSDKSNILTALRTAGKQFHNPEDDYIQIKYTGYTVNADGTQGPDGQWTAKELNDMTTEQRRYIAVTETTTSLKPDYFNTMFYRTYIGTPPQQDQQGEYQTPRQQIPCYAMKHFIPVYISPFPYYGYGRSAVVIAKYYEGAFFNGSISCNATPLPYVSVAVLDEYGFPHDNMLADQNGTFDVIAPGGNITMLFTYANEVLLKKITFNNTNNTMMNRPVTDAEAMRLAGVNSTRIFNLSINLSTLEGFAYNDNNKNGSYEPTIDTPLSGITIELNDYYFGRPVSPVTTDTQGHYIFRNLYPSKYNISAIENGYTLLAMEPINVVPDHNSYNISKPELSTVKGVVYYDTNGDTKYTAGEEANGIQVKLSYTKLDSTDMPVNSTTTNAAGTYSFSSLVPGKYTVNASKRNSTTGYLDYRTEQTVTLEANKTTWANISLAYAPVTVTGYTTYGTTTVDNVPVTFSVDKSVKNNTAKAVTASSDASGLYVVKLLPGTYNISVTKANGATVLYTFEGKLSITLGQRTTSYNIALTKNSITVSGTTKYNGVNKANMTITFTKDYSIENNTAVDTSTKSSTTGSYTIELNPGSYNISVEELVNESGQNVTYTFSGQLTVTAGEAPQTFDIILAREQTP